MHIKNKQIIQIISYLAGPVQICFPTALSHLVTLLYCMYHNVNNKSSMLQHLCGSLNVIHDSLDVIHDDSLNVIHDSLDVIHDDSLDVIHDSLDVSHDDSLDVIHDSLDVIHDSLDVIHDSLDVIHDSLDVSHDDSLDVIHGSLANCWERFVYCRKFFFVLLKAHENHGGFV